MQQGPNRTSSVHTSESKAEVDLHAIGSVQAECRPTCRPGTGPKKMPPLSCRGMKRCVAASCSSAYPVSSPWIEPASSSHERRACSVEVASPCARLSIIDKSSAYGNTRIEGDVEWKSLHYTLSYVARKPWREPTEFRLELGRSFGFQTWRISHANVAIVAGKPKSVPGPSIFEGDRAWRSGCRLN